MTFFHSRTAASLAALAALSMSATPALAHGRGGWHGHRHHDGIDGGDLLAGLLVVGGIAAIATVASNADRKNREERVAYPGGPTYGQEDGQGYDGQGYEGDRNRAPDYGSRDYPDDRGPASSSFDRAADACASEIERGERHVDTIDNVRRMGDRYSVEGRLANGSGFACSVDDDGQIRSIAVDGHGLI